MYLPSSIMTWEILAKCIWSLGYFMIPIIPLESKQARAATCTKSNVPASHPNTSPQVKPWVATRQLQI